MEDQTKPTPQKSALRDSTTKRDEEGVPEGYCSVSSSEGESAVKAISDARLTTHGDKESRKETEKQIVAKIQRIRLQHDCCMMFMEHLVKERNYFESLGLSANCILEKVKERLEILLKYTKEQNISIEQDLKWFQQRLFDIYVTSNPYRWKTIQTPKITTKFRPLCPVVTREAKIVESGEEFDKLTISDIIVIQGGVITYSHHCMTVCCVTRDGDRNNVHCPSSVTSFTRIGQDMVLATLPFQEMILIISPTSFKIKNIQLGLYLVAYLEHSTLIGVEMFGKTVYQMDWGENRIKHQFITKEAPTDIAVGVHNILLITFSSINRVICYNMDGQLLWEVETHSLNLPSKISLYQSYFYVLQGQIIYRISAKGSVTKRDIGRKCRSISVGKDTILVTDYFGKPHAIQINKDFWPKLSHNHQLHTPSLKDYIDIEDCNNITNILPMSTSSTLIIYKNKKAKLFTDNEEIINQNNLVFLELPSFSCRINTNRFLVFYREMKGFQCITCPELRKGPLIKVQTDYMKVCHIVSNKCLAVTTTENKNEIHILLINEDKVDITERISLGHSNVTIAATPINFVVVDGRENKMVFYSTCGEELFQKYLPFYGYPHHIYSDNVHFYVLFKRHSILICYDIYGEMKWQWQLPFPVHPHIAVFQGTVYLPDTQLNRVLLYKYQDRPSGCCLHLKNPYIRNLNLRLKEKKNDKKLVIGEICNLANGQLVVSDINHDCLLYISNEGDIVSRLSLPSTATDICRWDSNQIGVTLPLQKQLRVIGNLSKTVRSVSLRQPYVQVCKMGEGEIVCYCDKPSHLDILTIKKNYNQVETIKTINIPFFVKSLAIENESRKLLIVTRKKAFQYITSVSGGGHVRNSSSIQMVPSVLMPQVEHPSNLYGVSFDKMFVYLIDNSRIFTINDYNLVVRDYITNIQLNIYIDLVDVFSRNMCVSEMLSSTLHLQDLTVSDEARHVDVASWSFVGKQPVETQSLVIIENHLIAGFDRRNKNIKILTFDGHLLDSIKLNVYNIKMYQWQSNALVITTDDDDDDGDNNDKCRLLTLKVEFPLSLVIYQTINRYKCISSLSNNQLVVSKWEDERILYVVDIDEIHATVNVIKQINLSQVSFNKDIYDIIITANDVIIVTNLISIIFFNSDGQYLHSVRHYMGYVNKYNNMITDDSYLYIYGQWDRYYDYRGYKNIVCLTLTGEYDRIFLNDRIYKDKVDFSCINCKGSRFVGSHRHRNKLYVEGLFKLSRERFPVSHLQTDKCSVQVKDIDISDEGKTVVCEKANNGNVKIFDKDGELLCHRDLGSLVGGVCFTQGKHIMATVPKRKEIFQLNGKDLKKSQAWTSLVPYGVIWRYVGNIYWCQHIELIECHCIKIDGDQVNILESVSLLNLDSGLRFPSITSETNKEIFGNELINKLKYSEEDEVEMGKSGEIIGKGRLKVRCGKYIAESMPGTDEISVRRLPYRTAMVPFSIPAFKEPVNYNLRDIRDRNSKLIKLDDNVSVLMFRESLILIGTTGDILQHKQLPQQQPLDICWWTHDCFIVIFGEQLMFFNRDLCRLKTINSEKYYNRIYKYNDNQLVCGGGHYENNDSERVCGDCYYVGQCKSGRHNYYVDVVEIKGGTCKYIHEVCSGVNEEVENVVFVVDIVVTSGGDTVVAEEERERWRGNVYYYFCWYREHLVRIIKLPGYRNSYFYKPFLTTQREHVYITDKDNNIYQIPGYIEQQTSTVIEHLTFDRINQYLLLMGEDNEVYKVLGFDVSDNSFMVFGIIPGRQSFAFFHFDK